jgi:hypothetical protein
VEKAVVCSKRLEISANCRDIVEIP